MAQHYKDEEQKNQETYTFIEETIVPKKKRPVKKICVFLGAAIGFGIISAMAMCLTFPLFESLFRVKKQESYQAQITTQPSITPSRTPSVTTTPVASKKPEKQEETKEALTIYSNIYAQLKEMKREVEKSIVQVTAVKNQVDIFDNPYEKTNVTCGIVVKKTKEELIVLVNKKKMDGANSIKISFQDGVTCEAVLYNSNEELGIALISCKTNHLPEYTYSNLKVAEYGETYAIKTGDPIIALGSPNGYLYSVDYGIISNPVNPAYITDAKIELINTSLDYNANGDGVIVNLNGQIVGIITHEFMGSLNKQLNTSIGITKIKPMLEKMIEKQHLMYTGITANDVTSEISSKVNVPFGIYVTEVEANSPAFTAGIKIGDVIQTIDGKTVTTMSTFSEVIGSCKTGQKVTIGFMRTGLSEPKDMQVVIEVVEKK